MSETAILSFNFKSLHILEYNERIISDRIITIIIYKPILYKFDIVKIHHLMI